MAFQTVERTLGDTVAMRLYEKAKRFGIWNPSDIDFSQDVHDWQRITDDQRDALLQTTSLGKHTRFFRRFLDEVAASPEGLARYHGASYRALFGRSRRSSCSRACARDCG